MGDEDVAEILSDLFKTIGATRSNRYGHKKEI